MTERKPWTKEQVEHLLNTERFEYQRIELPYGLATPGRDRSATARTIFPDRLDGKTVIDVGCNQGFFCFEAAKRGAKRVVGVDADPQFIRNCRQLADCLGLDVTFEVQDIERQPLVETFDYILSLNLLHHLRNPLSVLDNFVEKTSERLVLEMATIGRRDRPKLGLGYWAARSIAKLPVIFVGKDDQKSNRQVQKFFFSPSAVENLLIHQRGVFARGQTVASEHKGRFIYLADKRRIDHLLVVSGPTAAGKRTFVKRLRAGELPEVAAHIGIDPTAGWSDTLLAERMHEPSEPSRGNLIFHYDFLRPDLHRPKVSVRDAAMDILKTAKKVTFLTIWTPPEALSRQLKDATAGIGSKRLQNRYELIRKDYADPARVLNHYRDWNEFVKAQSADHSIVCVDGNSTRVLTVADWERQ